MLGVFRGCRADRPPLNFQAKRRRRDARQRVEIDVGLILLIVVLVLLLGGGGGYYAHGRYGNAGAGGVLGTVLVVLVVVWFLGGFAGMHSPPPL
jgi:hypothetical protein